MKVIASSLFAMLLFAGCAKTDMRCFTDPDFKGRAYDIYIVSVANTNLGYASELERAICQRLSKNNIFCIASLDVFPPTRSLTSDEKMQEMRNKNIEAHLVVEYVNGSTDSYEAGSMHTGNLNYAGNGANFFGTTTTVQVPRRNNAYNLKIVDVATSRNAWICGAHTYGSGMACVTNDAFVSSLSKEIIVALKDAGHLHAEP